MPCLVPEGYHPKLPGSYHCKSLSSLVRETYAHCHVPCLTIPAARWSSGEDTDDDALDTKQVILNEMRNREMKRQRSRCSVDGSPSSLPSAFFWSFTPLDPRSVVIHMGSSAKDQVEEMEAAGDADDESEAFFSVNSFFTRSTSRAATVPWSNDMYPPRSPATWEGLRNCEGWPFGLCRRPTVPPLPSTPADSWKWRNPSSNSRSSLAVRAPGQSPAPAYIHKIATSKPASPSAEYLELSMTPSMLADTAEI